MELMSLIQSTLQLYQYLAQKGADRCGAVGFSRG
eukprot:CAMPEP_0179251132 /NCGR_PEP_ID=MMETSP0797-20121207/21530_1 /TAXON_ID=47934 /ORGANISM="Dinophysis acuminata, Strain DAEP01" /LENGTH=33 /DNA_ID= /DNA_START= /DNA_END= /DNA_ORIENTATION=